MDILHSTVWTGQGCATTTWSILALVIATFAATLGLLAWFGIRQARRYESRGAERVVRGIAAASAVGIVLMAVYVVVFDGSFYRQIAFDGTAYHFEGCDGMQPLHVRVPLADIRDTAYRGRWTGGRSSRLVHEVVLTRDDGHTFVIPLDRTADTALQAAQARVLPPAVVTAYLAALRERGQEPPEAFRGR